MKEKLSYTDPAIFINTLYRVSEKGTETTFHHEIYGSINGKIIDTKSGKIFFSWIGQNDAHPSSQDEFLLWSDPERMRQGEYNIVHIHHEGRKSELSLAHYRDFGETPAEIPLIEIYQLLLLE